ncbi:MAG: DUF2007 domain-containing protein [Candidatus Edwardsbacteria bacterium]
MQKWVTVCKTNRLEAEIIKGKLESENIPVILQQESIGRIYSLTIDGLGEVRVLVPNKYLSTAMKILPSTPENSARISKKQKHTRLM